MANENQKTVSDWCEEHYPGQDTKQRLRDLFEEATELAAALNLAGVDELVDVVRKTWAKSEKDIGDASQVPGEIGDVQIATAWLASALKVDTQTALDDKMTVNRAKTTETSQARFARKEKIFKA
jgi:NTP pyrophosphatase (non-canonical NTP hydrolase)